MGLDSPVIGIRTLFGLAALAVALCAPLPIAAQTVSSQPKPGIERPLILVPGLLGSRLCRPDPKDPKKTELVWGTLGALRQFPTIRLSHAPGAKRSDQALRHRARDRLSRSVFAGRLHADHPPSRRRPATARTAICFCFRMTGGVRSSITPKRWKRSSATRCRTARSTFSRIPWAHWWRAPMSSRARAASAWRGCSVRARRSRAR